MRLTDIPRMKALFLTCLLLGVTTVTFADSSGMKYDPGAYLTVNGSVRGLARTNLAGLCEVDECVDETVHWFIDSVPLNPLYNSKNQTSTVDGSCEQECDLCTQSA